MNGSPRAPTPAVLNLIRFAMLGGVVALCLAMWFVYRAGRPTPVPRQTAAILVAAASGLALASGLGLVAIRAAMARADTPQKRASLFIVGYAIAEAPALFGGACLVLTASALPCALGLAVFGLAFLLLPVPEQDSPSQN